MAEESQLLLVVKTLVLETERLFLRAPREEDLPAIAEVASDERVAASTYLPHPFLREDAVNWLEAVLKRWRETDFGAFAVFTRHDEAFIGATSLRPTEDPLGHASISYWFAPRVWGCGYATEALREVLRFGFEQLAIGSVEGRCFAFNPASGRVMEKVGMSGPLAIKLPDRDGRTIIGEIRTLRAADFHAAASVQVFSHPLPS